MRRSHLSCPLTQRLPLPHELPPVPGEGIVTAPNRLDGADPDPDLVVECLDPLVRDGLSITSRPIAPRAHGSQVDRPVSPASGVVDLGRRSPANGTEAAVSRDDLGDELVRHHLLASGISPAL